MVDSATQCWHLIIPTIIQLFLLSFLRDRGLWLLDHGRLDRESLSHYSLSFTPVAIYLNTLVCSIRVAQSALFSSGSFCHVSLLLHCRPCSSPPSSHSSFTRLIFSKTDTLLHTRLKYPFLVGRLVLLLCSIHPQPCLNAFVW